MLLSARTHQKQWVIRPSDNRAAGLAKSLKVSSLLAQVLINRGVMDISEGSVFLRPKLTELIPPDRMPGAQTAANIVKQAVQNGKKITVYGDYDVDGITGVAILWEILKLLGAEVDYYIPHRIDEGYGLNTESVRTLFDSGTRLLITVDCGTTAFESAELAQQLGMELIITDHHQMTEQLPRACAIVHPAADKSYPNQDSAGAMVAFKLAWTIANEFAGGAKLEPKTREFMINATTLASMGTIADCLSLKGENRVLASYGLKALPGCNLCGIQALIETASLTGKDLDSFHIGFRLAPILNAAGRMGHARLAVELLTCNNAAKAKEIAEYLKQQNGERQKYERTIFNQAYEMVCQQGLNSEENRSIVLADSSWHSGVIGIVAARLVDKFHRPAIMINSCNHIAQGSARSIDGFDILKAISTCSHHLASFGGHKMAAGLKIETAKIAQFVADFENYAKENLKEDDMVAKLHIDAVSPLGNFSKEAVCELQLLEPFGQGNPKPVFATKGVKLASPPRKVGTGANHLQLAISDNTGCARCVGFDMGKLEKKLLEHEFFDVAYEPQINTYNGSSNVEFVLRDIQFE